MAPVSTTIKIDPELKSQAQQVLDSMGLNLSVAVNMFLQQVVREEAIPFRVGKPQSNTQTLAALFEVEQMKANPESYRGYNDVDSMINELLK